MSNRAIRVSSSDDDRGGMPPQVWNAWLIYQADPQRSAKRVAEAIGRPQSTVLNWMSKYQWIRRIEEEDRANQAELLRGARLSMVAEGTRAYRLAVRDMDNPDVPHKERAFYRAWVAGLVGLGPRKPAELPAVTNDPEQDAHALPLAELAELARAGDAQAMQRMLAVASGLPDPGPAPDDPPSLPGRPPGGGRTLERPNREDAMQGTHREPGESREGDDGDG